MKKANINALNDHIKNVNFNNAEIRLIYIHILDNVDHVLNVPVSSDETIRTVQ